MSSLNSKEAVMGLINSIIRDASLAFSRAIDLASTGTFALVLAIIFLLMFNGGAGTLFAVLSLVGFVRAGWKYFEGAVKLF